MTPRIDGQGRPQPPVGGGELDSLVGFLAFQRAGIRWKCSGLDSDGLNAVLAPSSMTLGGLVTHLAYVEDHWSGFWMLGQNRQAPWNTVNWAVDPDWDWQLAADLGPTRAMALWQESVDRTDRVVARLVSEGGLDTFSVRQWPDGRACNLRWVMLHLIEEYARHLGHADLIRESLDGLTGD